MGEVSVQKLPPVGCDRQDLHQIESYLLLCVAVPAEERTKTVLPSGKMLRAAMHQNETLNLIQTKNSKGVKRLLLSEFAQYV